jgi:hypothetical protein
VASPPEKSNKTPIGFHLTTETEGRPIFCPQPSVFCLDIAWRVRQNTAPLSLVPHLSPVFGKNFDERIVFPIAFDLE